MKILKRLIITFTCVLVIGMIVFALCSGRKPFKGMKASEIASAMVRLTPPDKTILITEMEELTNYLNDVVIYNKDNSFTEYDGQGVTFMLTMSDGTQTEILEYQPFLVIDGVGYKTKYKPCEALNNYANRLLNEGEALVILENPPALNVISDNTSNSTLLGTYSWQRKNNDGTFTNMEADCAHPLECMDVQFQFETTQANALLRFAEEPDTILSVRCWSDDHWSDPTADSENVSLNGDEIELKTGGYIYEVTAEWNTEKSGYGGVAHYSFYAKVLEQLGKIF